MLSEKLEKSNEALFYGDNFNNRVYFASRPRNALIFPPANPVNIIAAYLLGEREDIAHMSHLLSKRDRRIRRKTKCILKYNLAGIIPMYHSKEDHGKN